MDLELSTKRVEKMVKWWVPHPSETSVSFCEKEAEKIMERWRRVSPFVTWPLMLGFGPLETGVSVWRRGSPFGDGGLSLETGVSIWRRGSQFGDGGLHLDMGISLCFRGLGF